ncbi:hypothetical protein M407DRAFT_11245, partial [Tulasnella calospora MUT 4182]
DPRLLAKLSPALRAEFPAVEVQKRFYALETAVPPEYRLDSQTFLVSVTKSSRLSGHPNSGSAPPTHPNPAPIAHSAMQSFSGPPHITQGSSLSVLSYGGRTVGVPDPDSRLGALRPLGSTPVSDQVLLSQPPSQTSHTASVSAEGPIREGPDSQPLGSGSQYPTNLRGIAAQEPAPTDLHSQELEHVNTPNYWQDVSSSIPSTIDTFLAQSSGVSQPIKPITKLHGGSGAVAVERSNQPLEEAATSSDPATTGDPTIMETYEHPNHSQYVERPQHLLRGTSTPHKNLLKAAPGSRSEITSLERQPGASVQALDEFYLDTSYFEEGGEDDEPVDGIPLTRG